HAVRDAEVDARRQLARFARDVAGTLAPSPDDDRLAGPFGWDVLDGGAVHEGACIAGKPFIAAHVVGELMKTGAHDDVACAPAASVRCRDFSEVITCRPVRAAF